MTITITINILVLVLAQPKDINSHLPMFILVKANLINILFLVLALPKYMNSLLPMLILVMANPNMFLEKLIFQLLATTEQLLIIRVAEYYKWMECKLELLLSVEVIANNPDMLLNRNMDPRKCHTRNCRMYRNNNLPFFLDFFID